MVRSRLYGMEQSLLAWAKSFKVKTVKVSGIAPSQLATAFKEECTQYFRLSALARSKALNQIYTSEADALLFKTRVQIEASIADTVRLHLGLSETEKKLEAICAGSIFGVSKKQGTSIRFPLTSCQPTKLCASACYAHDALDAAPNSIVRGVINGVLAEYYCDHVTSRPWLLGLLQRQIQRAIASALRERHQSESSGYLRRARIRLAHVGEAAAYPEFTNDVALKIDTLSRGTVTPVVYTRHRDARRIDSAHTVINFTLDDSSTGRLPWKPAGARIVGSAFNGIAIQYASVNFVEHHRWSTVEIKNGGNLCPVTVLSNNLHTCDQAKCDICFRREK